MGPIPESIGHLKKLNELDLSYNALNEEIPSKIGGLRNIRLLKLDNNQFSGVIPKKIGNLRTLRILLLNNNHLRAPLPHTLNISIMYNLKVVNLDNNDDLLLDRDTRNLILNTTRNTMADADSSDEDD